MKPIKSLLPLLLVALATCFSANASQYTGSLRIVAFNNGEWAAIGSPHDWDPIFTKDVTSVVVRFYPLQGEPVTYKGDQTSEWYGYDTHGDIELYRDTVKASRENGEQIDISWTTVDSLGRGGEYVANLSAASPSDTASPAIPLSGSLVSRQVTPYAIESEFPSLSYLESVDQIVKQRKVEYADKRRRKLEAQLRVEAWHNRLRPVGRAVGAVWEHVIGPILMKLPSGRRVR